MSHLKLFCPVESHAGDICIGNDPHILPFRETAKRSRSNVSTGVVQRAKLVFDNQRCSSCHRGNVEPIELDDALISRRNHRPIPCTATIVGFHCHSCGAEWPVYEATRAHA